MCTLSLTSASASGNQTSNRVRAMSCPVVHTKSSSASGNGGCPVVGIGGDGAQPAAWDGALQDGTARLEALLPNCQRPRDMLNKCRHAVITGERNEGDASNCMRESQCYLACSSAHNKQKRLVNTQCGVVLFDGPARNVRDRFRGCLSENDGDAAICESKLALMLSCAQKTLAK